MSWINFFGLIIVAVILVPNIIFAIRHKDGFVNLYHNRFVEIAEQIGRFGCFIFMFFTPPFLTEGYCFDKAKKINFTLSVVLAVLYCLGWIAFRKEESVRKSLVLSILPSLLFVESGILTTNIPLIIISPIFAICHIIISYKNAELREKHYGK